MAQVGWLGLTRPGLDKRASVHIPDKPYSPRNADKAVLLPGLAGWLRLQRSFFSLVAFLAGCMADRIEARFSGKTADEESRFALRLKRLFTKLGPTFIKAGQFLATRRDLLPDRIADELSALQDDLPAMSYNQVLAVIEGSLGRSPWEVFQSIESAPQAQASIAQVHKCRLQSGQQACVKVQRPDLESLFYADLGLMRLLAKLRSRLESWQGTAARHDWLEIVDEFGRVMFCELDFIAEGRNADALRYSLYFETQIKVPKVIWAATARRVLTMEYLPGVRIDDLSGIQAAGIDKTRLAHSLVDAYLKQILVNGFFHADPHPGNLAADGQGNLLLYDFGIMGELSDTEVQALFDGCRAILSRDAKGLIAAFTALNVFDDEEFGSYETNPLALAFDYLEGRDLTSSDLDSLESIAEEMIARGAVKLPYRLIRVAKTIVLIQALVSNLEPGFSFCKAAGPVIRRLMWEKTLGAFGQDSPEIALV